MVYLIKSSVYLPHRYFNKIKIIIIFLYWYPFSNVDNKNIIYNKLYINKKFYSTWSRKRLIKTYSNFYLYKFTILKENKHKTGIYRLINLVNSKSYIGSAIDLKERFSNYYNINHLLKNYNMNICKALIKYGYPNFKLEILEYCMAENRFDLENKYIKEYKPEYNILKIANTMPSKLGFIHKELTKIKMSDNNPNKIKVSVKDLLTDTEFIFNSIRKAEKFLAVNRGQINQYFNKNQVKPFKKRYIIKKIDKVIVNKNFEIIKGKCNSIKLEVLNLITNTKIIYSSIREAARALNIVHSTVHKYMKLNKPYLNKYIFKRLDSK